MNITLSFSRHGVKVAICFVISFALSHQTPTFSRMLTAKYNLKQFDDVSNQSEDSSTIQVDTTRTGEEPVNPVLKIWNEYKEQHSYRVISQEFWELKQGKNLEKLSNIDLNGRRFAVGFYSCPLQAGNRLHHFFNSMIWSIVTNRTFLYRYFDQKACFWTAQTVGGGEWTKCRVANKEEDCNGILKRSDWIPSFEDWKKRIRVTNMTSFSFWSTIDKRPKHRLWSNESEQYAGIVDIRDDLLVNFAPMLGQDAAILQYEQKRKYLLSTQKAQSRAKQLLAFGEDYLYGLLLEDCFQFQPSILPKKASTTSLNQVDTQVSTKDHQNDSSPSIMIALHSRHSKTNDDGSKIKREIRCLDQMLKTMRSSQDGIIPDCKIILLSDRQKTLTLLQEYIAQNHTHCTPMVAEHDEGESWRPEHGPFAGVGFFQDLGLVRSAMQSLPQSPRPQVGFIGSHHRSSSELVREILVYQQLNRHPELSKTSDKTPISTCYL